jgi:hypothetical protein
MARKLTFFLFGIFLISSNSLWAESPFPPHPPLPPYQCTTENCKGTCCNKNTICCNDNTSGSKCGISTACGCDSQPDCAKNAHGNICHLPGSNGSSCGCNVDADCVIAGGGSKCLPGSSSFKQCGCKTNTDCREGKTCNSGWCS